jgi:hypothetical protein
LTRAELECASQKLKNFNMSDPKTPSRTGWDGDEDAKADDSSMASDKPLGTLCSIMPVAPSGSRESKSKRPGNGFQRQGTGEKNRGGLGGRFKAFKSSSGGLDDLNSSGDSGGSLGSRGLMKDNRHQSNPRLHLRNGSRDDSFLSTISESTMSTDSTSTDRDSKINVADGSQI